MKSVLCYAKPLSIASRMAFQPCLSVSCQEWVVMPLRFLSLSRNCLTVASAPVALPAKNLYIQKEQFNLLGEDGKPSLFAPIMLATLSTCAQLERENITFRLQSGRKQYVAKGGRLGRKPGSVKTVEQKREEYKDVIALLRKGYTIRDVAKLTRKSVSTVQRIKKVLL